MTRKVFATMFMTLDGVVEEPQKWSFPYWGDKTAKFKDDELRATEALLLGRVTYEGFAAAWPGRKDPDGFADKFNSMPKYVASRTLKKLEWTNSHLLQGDVAAAVAKLKQQPGTGDLGVHGSVSLLDTLVRHDLVDRFHILTYPLVLGEGKRLFKPGAKTRLKLVESKSLDKGVVASVYERDPKPPG